MDTSALSPPDPLELVRRLDAEAIRSRLEDLDRERDALKVLLRAALRADRNVNALRGRGRGVPDRALTAEGRAADRVGGAARGLTVADVARRYRVGEEKVRAWIACGELAAVNTASALCGRPRWVVPADALAAFERRRAGGPPPRAPRRRKAAGTIDYYPDVKEEVR
jgi:hypothetical protein